MLHVRLGRRDHAGGCFEHAIVRIDGGGADIMAARTLCVVFLHARRYHPIELLVTRVVDGDGRVQAAVAVVRLRIQLQLRADNGPVGRAAPDVARQLDVTEVSLNDRGMAALFVLQPPDIRTTEPFAALESELESIAVCLVEKLQRERRRVEVAGQLADVESRAFVGQSAQRRAAVRATALQSSRQPIATVRHLDRRLAVICIRQHVPDRDPSTASLGPQKQQFGVNLAT